MILALTQSDKREAEKRTAGMPAGTIMGSSMSTFIFAATSSSSHGNSSSAALVLPASETTASGLSAAYPVTAGGGLCTGDVEEDLSRRLCRNASTRVCPPKIASSSAVALSGGVESGPGAGPVEETVTENCVYARTARSLSLARTAYEGLHYFKLAGVCEEKRTHRGKLRAVRLLRGAIEEVDREAEIKQGV